MFFMRPLIAFAYCAYLLRPLIAPAYCACLLRLRSAAAHCGCYCVQVGHRDACTFFLRPTVAFAHCICLLRSPIAPACCGRYRVQVGHRDAGPAAGPRRGGPERLRRRPRPRRRAGEAGRSKRLVKPAGQIRPTDRLVKQAGQTGWSNRRVRKAGQKGWSNIGGPRRLRSPPRPRRRAVRGGGLLEWAGQTGEFWQTRILQGTRVLAEKAEKIGGFRQKGPVKQEGSGNSTDRRARSPPARRRGGAAGRRGPCQEKSEEGRNLGTRAGETGGGQTGLVKQDWSNRTGQTGLVKQGSPLPRRAQGSVRRALV